MPDPTNRTEPQLDPAEAETLLRTLLASRKGKMGFCTRKMNQLKCWMDTDDGFEMETFDKDLESFKQAIYEFNEVHQSVHELLNEEERQADIAEWYEPRMSNFQYFTKEVKTWKQDKVQDQVTHQDSVSNTSEGSKESKGSKASSACRRAAAEKAALQARAAALESRHALKLRELQLRIEMEKMDLETDMAAADAKLRTLQSFDMDEEELEEPRDGMNAYLHDQNSKAIRIVKQDISEREFVEIATVPKTPLQRTLASRHPLPTGRGQPRGHRPSGAQSQPRAHSPVRAHSQDRPHRSSGAYLSGTDNSLTAGTQRQSDIADLIIMQQKLSLLPAREVTVYDGDPLTYHSFIRSFEYLIEGKTSSSADRLYFLEQYTSGQARDLVRSCLHRDARQGYAEARQLLEKQFGSEIKVTSAYLEKALKWTPIKVEDGKGLQAYALYLRGCYNAMQDLDMGELDILSNLRLMISKLPYKLRERWRATAYDTYQKTKRRARFQHLVEFLEKQAEILLDPLFGDLLQDSLSGRQVAPKTKTIDKQMARSKSRGSSFATAVALVADGKTLSQPKQQQFNFNADAHTATGTVTCAFCESRRTRIDQRWINYESKHTLIGCRWFKSQPHKLKVEFLKENGYCFGCLAKGHLSRDCRRRLTCEKCQRKHPTLLHIVGTETSRVEPQPKIMAGENREASVSRALVSAGVATGAGRDCALAIVPVRVKVAKGNEYILTYAFLDSGSSATFCTENLMKRLKAKGRKTEILLQTLGQERLVPSYQLTGLEVGNLEGDMYLDLPKVYTQEKIPVSKENLPTQKDLRRWPHLNGILWKEIDADIELLIGINVPKAMEPWNIINSQGNGPYAVKTVLGWVVNGPLNTCTTMEGSGPPTVTANRISVSDLEELFIRQYNEDFSEKQYEGKSEMSVEDRRFMEIMSSSVTLQNGHYHLPLPLRAKDVVMPDNYDMAKQRIGNLQRKFKRDESYALEYSNFMADVIKKGYAEKVPQEQLHRGDGKVWHIPHHGVYHKQKGKLRVVFDCTSTYKGTSLNKELLQGPDLTNTLMGVLLRFRQEPIAVMGDIEAMFHQVRVHGEHKDLLRFLWWPGGDTRQPLEVYRMTVHLFGAVSSPSIANFALQQTADDNTSRFGEEVTETIKCNFYVDDCLKSVPTVERAIELTRELRDACSRGGFVLTKLVSNNRKVLASIPEEHRARPVKDLDLDREKLPLERALGIQWNIESDMFTFKVTVKSRPPTRRGILSIVSSIYDPFGFLCPFILPAKRILQELCRAKLGWDEDIPGEFAKPWRRWVTELHLLGSFQVDRCMKPKDFGQVVTAELHHFCDASELGYGTVSYLRYTDSMGRFHVAFVQGKSRVTPLKQMTIPRLELAAATLAVRVDKMLKMELRLQLADSTFWTDSTSVLKYICNQTKRFHTYVANRVAVIHELSQEKQWRHVTSQDNPADDASRGLHVDAFLKSRWLKGPEFLKKREKEWPKIPEDLGPLAPDDQEVRKDITVNATQMDERNPISRLVEHYSSWDRLKRAVAWLLKLKGRLLLVGQERKSLMKANPGSNPTPGPTHGAECLSVEDMKEAEKAIIQFEQRQHFGQELAHLMTGKAVKRNSPICKLDPILDNGILRVGGRISKMAMPMEQKNPIILPKGSHLSKLILQQIHQRVGHSGRSHMLSKLQERFWLACANSLARKIIRSCVFCRRMQAKVEEQKMSDLPEDRLLPDLPPFTNVGIDYFGPIEVKRGRAHVKRWGVIFTCLVSRAVHLEVASHLDTNSCINALRRFMCRRGPVKSIRTDNGTNFVGAQKELKEALKGLDHVRIQNELLKDEVKWTFNPPFGAHHGGIWERLIRLLKKILFAVLKEQTLDDETLQTALCEVEAIMNDRPITTVSGDPNDLEPLTPNHLLQLKAQPIMPSGLFQKGDLYSRRRWRQAQYLADLFWKRWVREYAPLMQQRSKWNHPRRNLRPDDVVVIADDTAPRNSWLMGRVVKTFPGAKGLIRSVLVKTKSSTLQRPVDKLCLLLEAAD
ncbi:hypothetical protein N1851_008772 [Merluccius polli]|uniref:ribonuclease H n=1 Tax=Merluccius polli TaxID=89951 RepID=A0AA47N1U7_MERPO|nr:hypothetical protein N1851_008772 [Merluccius polli]